MLVWFWRVSVILGLLSYSISINFEDTYNTGEKLAVPMRNTRIKCLMEKMKNLNVSAVPIILERIEEKRKSLYLFDSGDNLDQVGLEIEAIASIGPKAAPYLIARLLGENGDSNQNIAMRAALVQALTRVSNIKDFPFTPYAAVKARINQDFPRMGCKFIDIFSERKILFFLENELPPIRKYLSFLDFY